MQPLTLDTGIGLELVVLQSKSNRQETADLWEILKRREHLEDGLEHLIESAAIRRSPRVR